ncbi:MAG: hypothetical protein IID44_25060 [Planctomycetes bacterium]|nr:hypothetical protein [Planctomycetota bacterium]
MMTKEILTESDGNGQQVQQEAPAAEPVNRIGQQTKPDPFDPASLRLGQDFAASVGVKKVLTNVICRKPGRQEFVRVRPGEDWRLQTALLTDDVSRESYTVDRDLWIDLSDEIKPVVLFTTITRQGTLILWPCKLPSPDGRSNAWNDSALRAAELAERDWIKLSANMAAGMYDTFAATGSLSEPEWPEDLEFRDVLRLCFQGRHITSHDHPILRSLRGEV